MSIDEVSSNLDGAWRPVPSPAFENVDLSEYNKVRAFCEKWRVKFLAYGITPVI